MTKSTISCGKHLAENADLSGSCFQNVNLLGATFDDVNLGGATFHNINLSDMRLTAAQIGGAVFRHIGPPPDAEGRQARQRPVTFDQAMLCDSRFVECDLSGVSITRCNIEGMTIDGVPVDILLAAYREVKQGK